MNVTRDVITDLLPVYFSGEASGDTKQVVEDYFREDPDFERIARRAATPLETLRIATAAPSDAEREKRDLEHAAWDARSRWVWLAAALYYTLLPFVSFVSPQLFDWLGGPHGWSSRIVAWAAAAFFWFLYIARLSRSNVLLAIATVISVGEVSLILNRLGVITSQSTHASGPAMAGIGILAALFLFLHFRSRPTRRQERQRTRAEIFRGLLFWVLLVALLTALAFFWRR